MAKSPKFKYQICLAWAFAHPREEISTTRGMTADQGEVDCQRNEPAKCSEAMELLLNREAA